MWELFRDIFTSRELVIPASQMIAYVIIINLLMLFNRTRACFLVSLSFALYWMFILNKESFVTAGGELTGGIFFYLGAALVFILGILVTYTNYGK